MLEVSLTGTLNLAELYEIPLAAGAVYVVDTGSESYFSVNSVTGDVTPLAEGTGVVLIQDGQGVTWQPVFISVLGSAEVQIREQIASNQLSVTVSATVQQEDSSPMTTDIGFLGGHRLIHDSVPDVKLKTITAAGKVANTATSAASANTASAIVARDASGNFSAGAITATSFSGDGASLTALNATQLAAGKVPVERLENIANTHIADNAQIADTKLAQITSANKVANSATTAAAANTPSAIVARDADGKFSAAMISLTGTVTNATDAATKAYVDSVAQGLEVKASVKVATTAAITLSGTQTIDGVALLAGDRVLVKNQAAAANNGIYLVAAGAWSRAADADSVEKLSSGSFVFVERGTVNADAGFVMTEDDPESNGYTFAQFSGAGQLTAGAGLTKTGNTLDVVAADSTITVNGDSIQVGQIANANVADGANIAYGKLNLTGSIVNADISASAQIAYGKLNLTGAILNADLAGSIADTKLNTITSAGKVANSATTGTASKTAETLVLRDADGRARFATPSHADDAANKGYVDTEIARFVVNETPAGTVNGSNLVFSLVQSAAAGTLQVFVSGLMMLEGSHYSVSGSTLTFVDPYQPITGEWVRVSYRKA